jgi:2-polyprenyl-3-methyl-5-hydroxy-6-metoxy-1,4-benzoquinol methylase
LSFVSQIPEIARTDHPILQPFQRFLKYFPLGLLAFEVSFLIKKVALLVGKTKSERAVEYPWVLKQLNTLHRGARVLDVGCCESLLSFKLVAMGFQVVGIDIRNILLKTKRCFL